MICEVMCCGIAYTGTWPSLICMQKCVVFVDNDCSRYMIGNFLFMIEFDHKEHCHVTYEDNNKNKVFGENIVGNPSTITIDGVSLVK